MSSTQLPTPDEFGNYWLDRNFPEIGQMHAIFPCKRVKDSGVHATGEYFLSLGLQGILFDGRGFMTFDTPERALTHYKRLTRKRIGKGAA